MVLSKPRCNIVISPLVRALVKANSPSLRHRYDDRRIEVYEVVGPLVMPTETEVAAEPELDIAALC